MYLFKRGLLPYYFRDMFIRIKQEILAFFYIPHCRTNFQKFSVRFQGAKFFNSLSREIQNNESICTVPQMIPNRK